MKRSEFLAKIIRTLLFAVLALIGILLGTKATKGRECSVCPGYGRCVGETDCSKYDQKDERG